MGKEESNKHITLELRDEVAVIRMRYARFFRFEEYDQLEEELLRAAAGAPGGKVLVNLEAVEYVTSRFIGVLAALHKKVVSGGGRMAVCRLRPETMRVFQLTRMDALIPVCPSEEEALKTLAK